MSRHRNARTGRISSAFQTRSGETIWVVAWDDRGRAPPFDVEAASDLEVGASVRLDGQRLVRR